MNLRFASLIGNWVCKSMVSEDINPGMVNTYGSLCLVFVEFVFDFVISFRRPFRINRILIAMEICLNEILIMIEIEVD